MLSTWPRGFLVPLLDVVLDRRAEDLRRVVGQHFRIDFVVRANRRGELRLGIEVGRSGAFRDAVPHFELGVIFGMRAVPYLADLLIVLGREPVKDAMLP